MLTLFDIWKYLIIFFLFIDFALPQVRIFIDQSDVKSLFRYQSSSINLHHIWIKIILSRLWIVYSYIFYNLEEEISTWSLNFVQSKTENVILLYHRGNFSRTVASRNSFQNANMDSFFWTIFFTHKWGNAIHLKIQLLILCVYL